MVRSSPRAAATPTARQRDFDGRVAVGKGRFLHIRCTGIGGPTVVFESGGPGGTSSDLVGTPGFPTEIAGFIRFCGYDRAGLGHSDPTPPGTRTVRDSVADLHTLLADPVVGCPCVLLGESLGGEIALLEAAEHPEDLGGLVLLDAPAPGYLDSFVELSPVGGLEATFFVSNNPEHLDLIASFRQVDAATLPTGMPVVVVTHGVPPPPPCFPCSPDFPVDRFEVAWQAQQAAMARAMGARLVVAETSGHRIAEDQPEVVVDATRRVVQVVRDPGSWANPAAATPVS
jgi:pimeloyl-ACP methyl ester carboxylesterase